MSYKTDELNEYKTKIDRSGKPRFKVSKNRKNIKKNIMIPLTIFFVMGFLVLLLWAYGIRKSKVEMRDIKAEVEWEQRKEELKKEFEEEYDTYTPEVEDELEMLGEYKGLYENNPDLAGWLKIDDTVIDYPVMYKEGDNDFYLEHGFNGSTDVNGTLVLDKRCHKDGTDLNLLIHGHNMKSGEMFGSLKNYLSEEYFKEHKVIHYSDLYHKRNYEIFAVFTSQVYNEDTEYLPYYDYINIDDRYEFNEYVQGAKENSVYDTGVDVRWGDKLLTLSTCEYSKENGRLVVVAKCSE